MKKIYKHILGLMAVILLFASCQSQSVSTTDKEEISIMMIMENGMVSSDLLFTKIFKEKFDVDVKFILNSMDTHMEKLKLLVASNELPDVITPLPDGDAKGMGVKKALVPINEHLDKMPNYKKYLDQDYKYYAAVEASDGNIYSIARFADGDTPRYVPIIRQDLLDEFGVEPPRTFDELYSFLMQVKEKYPKSKGVINREKMSFINDFGIHYGTSLATIYNQTTDSWEFGPANAGYKELLQDFNRLYQAKLLDSEFFTAGEEQWTEKMLSGEGVFALSWPEYADTTEEQYKALHPEDTKFDLAVILPLTSKTAPNMRIQKMENMNSWCSWSIAAKSNHIDTIIQMADYMYTEEAISLANWGEKDVYYIEEGGKRKFKENVKAAYNPDGTLDIRAKFGINYAHIGRVERNNDKLVSDFSEQVTTMLNETYHQKNVDWYVINNFIKLAFTDEQLETLKTIDLHLNTLVAEKSIKFITGEIPMSEYEIFLEELRLADYQQAERIYNDAYDAYKQNIKQNSL